MIQLTKGMTYRGAGVDIDRIHTAQKSIGDILSETHKIPTIGKVMSGFGHYASIVKLGSERIALHADGVGTKSDSCTVDEQV